MTAPPLIVIGATGGTGGSVLRTILEAAGAWLGRTLTEEIDEADSTPLAGDEANRHGDFVPFARLLGQWVPQVLAATRSLEYGRDDLPPGLFDRMVEETRGVAAALWEHRPVPEPLLWGWKNPRSIFVLPVLAAALPSVSFVHLVRDGRVIARSDNRIQMQRHYADLFGRPPRDDLDRETMRFWAATNLQARACGLRLLGERYQPLRLEDICGPDHPGLRVLLHRLVPELPAAGLAAALAAAPAAPLPLPAADDPLTPLGDATLAAFGYL